MQLQTLLKFYSLHFRHSAFCSFLSLAWALFQVAFYDGRITRHHDVAWNIMHNHTACRDYNSVSDGHSGTYGHIASEPAVFTDRDRMSGLLCLTTKNMVLGVLRGIELTVGTQKSMITDRNKCSVQNRAAEIEKCTFTQTDAVSMVAPERRSNVCGSGHITALHV